MIYFICPYLLHSGNVSTINRIMTYFKESKLVLLDQIDSINFKDDDLIIGLHAYKVGKYLIKLNQRFIIIIGGTDLNCDYLENDNKKMVINSVLKKASKIVVFNDYHFQFLEKLNFSNKTHVIPQSIGQLVYNKFDIKQFLKLNSESKLYLIIGNLREVKDPFYLINQFKFLYDKMKYNFVYIGSNLDNYNMDYYWINYIDGLPSESIYAALRQADGIINTSKSEGMSITILEAMKLECLVYARINKSNEYIIKHNYSGFLFSSPEEFMKIITLDNNNHVIKANALNQVLKYYNTKVELNRYKKLVLD